MECVAPSGLKFLGGIKSGAAEDIVEPSALNAKRATSKASAALLPQGNDLECGEQVPEAWD
jgi:hypothetical protein